MSAVGNCILVRCSYSAKRGILKIIRRIDNLLEHFPGIQTNDAEKLREILFDELGATYFDLPHGQKSVSIDLRWCRRNEVTLVSSACEGATDVEFSPSTFVRQYFELNPSAHLKFGFGRQTLDLSSSTAPVIVPANRDLRVTSKTSHNVVVLRIEQSALNRQMEFLLGNAISGDINFEASINQPSEKQQILKRAVLQFVSEVNVLGPTIRPLAQIELEQALIIKFLLFNEHNLSEGLSLQEATPSFSQLRRVEDYLESHWDEPFDIGSLVKVSGISARSIFRHFRNFRGISPRDFVKAIRLRHVRRLLQAAGPNASVTAIALACGFQSLGHFSREYRLAFGEYPSDTLTRPGASTGS